MKNLVTAEEPHRLIVKRNITGEQGKSTTTPGTSPRRNSNKRNLDPEAQRNLRPKNLGAAEEPHRLIINRNLTGEEYHDTRDLTKEELESEEP